MKYTIKSLLLILSFVISLPSFAGKEEEEGYKKQIEKNDSLIKELTKKIDDQSKLREERKSELDILNYQFNDLSLQLNSLESEGLIYEREREKKEKENAQNKLSDLENKLVNFSLLFLNIPYEEYSINEVAIPAFKKGYASIADNDKEIKYKGLMLENYAEDWNNLKKFLNENKNTTFNTAGATRDKLTKLKTYIQYAGGYSPNGSKIPGFGEGWQNTYLGKIMIKLYNVLSDAKSPEDTETIQYAFKEALKMMQ